MDLMEIRDGATGLSERVRALVITNQSNLDEANGCLELVRKFDKVLETIYKKSKKAIDEAKAKILSEEREDRKIFKELDEILTKQKIGPFLLAEQEKAKQARYKAELEAKEKEEERALDAALAAEQKGLPEAGAILNQAIQTTISVAPVQEAVEADGFYFVDKAHYEIERPGLVPCEYHMIDESKLGGVVRSLKAGAMGKIPGVRVWVTKEPRKRLSSSV